MVINSFLWSNLSIFNIHRSVTSHSSHEYSVLIRKWTIDHSSIDENVFDGEKALWRHQRMNLVKKLFYFMDNTEPIQSIFYFCLKVMQISALYAWVTIDAACMTLQCEFLSLGIFCSMNHSMQIFSTINSSIERFVQSGIELAAQGEWDDGANLLELTHDDMIELWERLSDERLVIALRCVWSPIIAFILRKWTYPRYFEYRLWFA